jgi:tRNA pseudouridine38-40 synthase
MMQRYKLTIAYDGTAYCGWQRQQYAVPTVQRTLELAIGEIVNHPVTVSGSSRTDTGVHAWGQVATIDTETQMEPQRLRMAINSRLPPDILIREITPAPPDLDVSRASRKRYRYVIWQSPDRPVFYRHYVYHYWHELDISPMQEACRLFEGKHDFAAFQGRKDELQTTIREIYHCSIGRRGPIIIFSVEGNGFLYHMVRTMAGTLLETGRGRWGPGQIRSILASTDRREAGPCLPPMGLCLQWIRF